MKTTLCRVAVVMLILLGAPAGFADQAFVFLGGSRTDLSGPEHLHVVFASSEAEAIDQVKGGSSETFQLERADGGRLTHGWFVVAYNSRWWSDRAASISDRSSREQGNYSDGVGATFVEAYDDLDDVLSRGMREVAIAGDFFRLIIGDVESKALWNFRFSDGNGNSVGSWTKIEPYIESVDPRKDEKLTAWRQLAQKISYSPKTLREPPLVIHVRPSRSAKTRTATSKDTILQTHQAELTQGVSPQPIVTSLSGQPSLIDLAFNAAKSRSGAKAVKDRLGLRLFARLSNASDSKTGRRADCEELIRLTGGQDLAAVPLDLLVLRAAAALELDDYQTGAAAGKVLEHQWGGELTDPASLRILAELDRRGWLVSETDIAAFKVRSMNWQWDGANVNLVAITTIEETVKEGAKNKIRKTEVFRRDPIGYLHYVRDVKRDTIYGANPGESWTLTRKNPDGPWTSPSYQANWRLAFSRVQRLFGASEFHPQNEILNVLNYRGVRLLNIQNADQKTVAFFGDSEGRFSAKLEYPSGRFIRFSQRLVDVEQVQEFYDETNYGPMKLYKKSVLRQTDETTTVEIVGVEINPVQFSDAFSKETSAHTFPEH